MRAWHSLGLMNQKIVSIAIWEDGHICVYSFGSMYEIEAMIVGSLRVHTYQHDIWLLEVNLSQRYHVDKMPNQSDHDHRALWVCLNTIVLSAIVGWQNVALPFSSYPFHCAGLSNRVVVARQQTRLGSAPIWLLGNRPVPVDCLDQSDQPKSVRKDIVCK